MFLGSHGFRANVQQAARWLQLAAEKGHAGAQATLGNLLFQSGRAVRGLAMMTAALHRAPASEQGWIRQMQEEAFALADEVRPAHRHRARRRHHRPGRQLTRHVSAFGGPR